VASIDGQPIKGDLATLTWVTDRLGINRQAINTYRVRSKGSGVTPTGRRSSSPNPFPQPVAKVAGVELFRIADLEEWNARRQPRGSTE